MHTLTSMETRTLVKLAIAAGLATAVGTAGCSLSSEETGSSPDQVTAGGVSAATVLRSVVFLRGGCTATKVGPKHLLVAARCVAGNEAFAAGKSFEFTSAASGPNTIAAEEPAPSAPADAGAPKDAGAASKDGGSADAGKSGASDAGASKPSGGSSDPNARTATVASVSVYPSYTAKCTDDVCDFGRLAASDAADIAVVVLEEELASVPSLPIDLDAVSPADPLLVVNSGCATFASDEPQTPKATRSMAVPAKSANHEGSPYQKSPQLVTRLGGLYVVSAGTAWGKGGAGICKSDIGAPIFRAGTAAVAGVTSNFTTFAAGGEPVTLHHTRVDTASKIGPWLAKLGVETIHSCSETAGGCTKRTYDGGAPEAPTKADPTGPTEPGDGGEADAIAPDAGEGEGGATQPEEPSGPRSEQLPGEGEGTGEGEYTPDEEPDYSDAAAPKKKKAAADGGCSAAPGRAPTGELAIGVALALGAAVARRRRR